MVKKIEIEWPEAGIKVNATLLEKEEPELSERLWNLLNKPLRMICQHTLSTGHLFSADARPPRHPVTVGSQATPIGRKRWRLTQLEPGMLTFSGYGSYGGIFVAYGPHITEPLLAAGSVVAIVDKKDLDNLMKAGKAVWNAQFITHKLMTMTIRRKR